MAKATFQAKKYENRKGEQKLNISGSQEAFKELLKGGDSVQEEFDNIVKAALAAK